MPQSMHYVIPAMNKIRIAKYKIGQVVKHRVYPFRGVVFDIDPEFDNTEEWWQSIPAEVRPRKDQPFYHLFAENAESEYIAYVSEQNLLPDTSDKPIRHPQVDEVFVQDDSGVYRPRNSQIELIRGRKRKRRGRSRAFSICHAVESPALFLLRRCARPPEPAPPAAGLPASCAPLPLSSAALPAICAAAPRPPSDRSAGRHRPWRNRSAAAAG